MHFLILAAAAAPCSAQVFKWVDERGITHYGERPPRGAKASEVQDKLASPPPARGPAGPAQKSEPRAQPGRSAPAPNPPSAPAPPPAANAPPTPQELQAAAKKAECDKERTALAQLRAGTTSYSLNSKGERVVIDNSAAIAEQEQRVSKQCGG